MVFALETYWPAGGALNSLRDSQSHRNTAAGRGEPALRARGPPIAGR
jgi:hypothetical protein